MTDDGSGQPPGDGNPLGGLLERARPDAGFAAHQSLQMLQSKLFGRTAQTTMVGRYTLGPRLGAGGGGTVYRALDTESGRTVAIKLLISDARGSSARARLLREAQSLAKLKHPNIVEFYDVGTFDPGIIDPRAHTDGDNGVFLAMEFVEGENLATWAETERPWKIVRDVFVAAGRGLAHAHARGFAHRDFKPSNVLVGDDGRTRVADFGLARVTRELTAPLPGVSVRLTGESSLPGLHVSLTKPGAVIGTPAYMAPEQHLSSRADARSDQFSFCLALYESLYRHSPFIGSTPGKVLEAKLRGIIAAPPRDTKIPSRLHRAIVRGLAPDPSARHPSMDVLLDALSSDGGGPTPVRVVAAVGAAAVIVGVGAWLSVRQLMRDPCEHVPSAPAGWSAETAERLHAAASNLAVGYAENTFARAREDLDRFATRWSSTRTEACSADATGEALPARLACLDEHARLLAATTSALAEPTTSMLELASAASEDLPDPHACLDDPPPLWIPRSALDDEELAPLRDEVARVHAAVALRRPEAADLAAQLLARAQAADIVVLVPRVRLLLAVALAPTDAAAALGAVAAAHQEAEALELGPLAERAAVTALELAVVRGDRSEAERWLATLDRGAIVDTQLAARASVAAAELAELDPTGDAQAHARCREAERIVGDGLDGTPSAVAVARRCATIALAAGRRADALELAELAAARAERAWGSDHPVAATARVELAIALTAAGRVDAALAHARTGLDVLERGTATDDPRRLGALLVVAELQRAHDLAESSRRRAEAETIAQLDDNRRLAHSEATFMVAMALADRSRAQELADLAEARARRLREGTRLALRISAWRRR